MNTNHLLIALGGEVKLSDIEEITKQKPMSMTEAIQEVSAQKVIEKVAQLVNDVETLKQQVEELKGSKV